MWWVVFFSVFFLLPAAEMADEWRLHRSAEKELVEMRKHTASGDRWDVTRGCWIVNDDGNKGILPVVTDDVGFGSQKPTRGLRTPISEYDPSARASNIGADPPGPVTDMPRSFADVS